MVFVIFVLFMIVWAILCIAKEIGYNDEVFTDEELRQMNIEMIGKSQKECREIIKKYRKRHKKK